MRRLPERINSAHFIRIAGLVLIIAAVIGDRSLAVLAQSRVVNPTTGRIPTRPIIRKRPSAPFISSDSSFFSPTTDTLVISGGNFEANATLSISNSTGPVTHGQVDIVHSNLILVSDVEPADVQNGVTAAVTNPGGANSGAVFLNFTPAADPNRLTSDDVKTVIAQAVTQAEASGLKATIAVVDEEGNVLGEFKMTGAPDNTLVGLNGAGRTISCAGNTATCGLEGISVPSCTAAITKAITGSFLSSQGEAFSTRTAGFIIQEHFPPSISFQAGGPLFGVQFSQLLCSDVNARSPLGLSADPGGLPLYKNGIRVGGVGVEGDGRYTADLNPLDNDVPPEELVAVAATRGFEAPSAITGDKIIVNGIRFQYVNATMPPAIPTQPFASLDGSLVTCGGLAPATVLDAQPSKFHTLNLDPSIPTGRVDNRFFPFVASADLSAADVNQILVQAAKQAFITRAAIRQPIGSPAEVNITVVDKNGNILGIYSTIDAPIFGFDVSAQKARTATFFSSATAGSTLTAAGFGNYVSAAGADGLQMNGSIAFTDRANGFLSRPFFPDGINGTANGPFSKPIAIWSPFNDGLQLDLLVNEYFIALLNGQANALTPPCPSINAIANGIQIFPGSVPLFKNGVLVGGVGVSGDGVDQDDLISSMGSIGFEAPLGIRSDTVLVRGIRLPYVVFPRQPDR